MDSIASAVTIVAVLVGVGLVLALIERYQTVLQAIGALLFGAVIAYIGLWVIYGGWRLNSGLGGFVILIGLPIVAFGGWALFMGVIGLTAVVRGEID